MDKDPSTIFEHLPKKTPAWAVGFVAVVVSIATSLVCMFVISRTEVQQYIGWAQKRTEAQADINNKNYTDTLAGVLHLINSNQEHLTILSQQLGATQQQNTVLTERVQNLEKAVTELRVNLSTCENKLKVCEERKQYEVG